MPIYAPGVLCAQFTRDLFAIAKFLFIISYFEILAYPTCIRRPR